MKTSIFRAGAMVLLLVSAVAHAQTITLTGKLQSKVTAQVAKREVLTVTDDKGGWFDSGLTMQQLGGWTTPYEVQARLKVVSSSGVFQVRMDDPLMIRNQSNAAQVFRSPKVLLGNEGGEPKALAVGQNAQFQNPAPPVAGADTTGYYTLAISAYPPEGDFKSTVGTYTGVLSMTFEPVIKVP
ncbi:hypothetical protein BLA18112_05392 [Burkholderia lata]|uniref:Fimbrial assembly protein n=1 Tax=Burkholderia lata (strain ATCC 17760 / DSM 23089 / LMG 22485 / NCIMB 9086 / R18194 / 383) TaxID=482957 RepID=A0A6P2YP09_BURL3|nr:hypothetical protein [Burkholderia lata]VWD21555.1 hypothetical protein BLA18112_05392 [Burkholderia lata]